MKLEEQQTPIEKCGDFSEKYFGMGDEGFLFEILRNKLYSDKIGSICREIACNARDAHREADKSNEPIEIHFSFQTTPFFKVKDFGVGISPDRLENIFINYASSTKKNDNSQTGGFGLGAKTPFAYVDNFTIISNFDGTKRTYLAYIDESKRGKIALTGEIKTDEINGTEIIIPIEKYHFDDFKRKIFEATEFWEVKPRFFLNGEEFEGQYKNYLKHEIYGNDWQILTNLNYYNSKLFIIVDGIQYGIPKEKMSLISNRDYSPLIDEINSYSTNGLIVFFNTGEITFSASRENIEFSEISIENIKNKLYNIYCEIKTKIETNLGAAKTYEEALNLYTEYSTSLDKITSLVKPSWNGNTVFRLSNITDGYSLNNSIYLRQNNFEKKQFKSLSKEAVRIFNDVGGKSLSKFRLEKIIKNFPDKDKFQVLTSRDIGFYENHNLKLLDFHKASKWIKVRKKSDGGTRLVLYKLNNAPGWEQIKIKDLKNDENEKIFIQLTSYKTSMAYSSEILFKIKKLYKNISFYGAKYPLESNILKDIQNKFSDIKIFIDKILNEKDISFDEIKTIEENKYSTRNFYNLDINQNDLKNKNGALSKFLEKVSEFKQLERKYSDRLEIIKLFSKLDGAKSLFDLDELRKKAYNEYPLLKKIGHLEKEDKENFLRYVNLIDEFGK